MILLSKNYHVRKDETNADIKLSSFAVYHQLIINHLKIAWWSLYRVECESKAKNYNFTCRLGTIDSKLKAPLPLYI